MTDKSIEFHFFHGFLGQAEDWRRVSTNLEQSFPQAHVFTWDLKDLLPKGERWSFASWAQIMEQKLTGKAYKVLVGYSLGGRLALHLNPAVYQEIFLLAAHPGLETGREHRLQKDRLWAEQLRKGPTSNWMHQWNQQDIFALDTVRPFRDIHGQEDFWAQVMESFSLGLQEDKRNHLQELRERVHWLVGERDLKFIQLKKSIEPLLPPGHVFEVPQSGHGLIFEQPQWVARFIEDRVNYD